MGVTEGGSRLVPVTRPLAPAVGERVLRAWRGGGSPWPPPCAPWGTIRPALRRLAVPLPRVPSPPFPPFPPLTSLRDAPGVFARVGRSIACQERWRGHPVCLSSKNSPTTHQRDTDCWNEFLCRAGWGKEPWRRVSSKRAVYGFAAASWLIHNACTSSSRIS